MNKIYPKALWVWCWVLGLMLASAAARAQSGPYGNEWIVPSQSYYKIKITQNGIYRLDQSYLTRAGLTASTNPQRVQLWRRGQQVALYGGGNQNQLDATTYFEFYGQRNDGQLDRGMYKNAADQPHQLYSLFSDTAAYFLTVSATTNGRRMTDLTTAATGTVHPNWLQPRLRLMVSPETAPYSTPGNNLNFGNNGYYYGKEANNGVTYLPWADRNEGFASNEISSNSLPFTFVMDSLYRRSGAQTWLEILLIGTYSANPTHSTTLSVLPGGTGTARQLTVVTYPQSTSRRVRVPLQASDIGADGRVGIQAAVNSPTSQPNDRFRIGYIRVVSSQATRWVSGQRALAFWNDSTQAGSAYYQLDSIPATVVGYDVTDPANVRRTAGVALSGQRRAYGFAGAVGSTHKLLLADAARSLTPGPAQRLTFTNIDPNVGNFLIVTHQSLMKAAGSVPDAVQEYVNYRRSAGPGRTAYDVTVVTADQLYDQFHYGERSPLAVRQYAQYMMSTGRSGQYLLLLGKGVLGTENVGAYGFYRQASAAARANVPDLVPTSTRAPSDVFFTADWTNGNYYPRMATGRVQARTPQQVIDYLNKLRAHENPTPAAWRKNILHLGGGESAPEQRQFRDYLREYQRKAEKPYFGARVDTIFNTTNGQITVDLAQQINEGRALVTYFGHGSNNTLDVTPLSPTAPTSTYANAGKYSVFLAGGCAIGNTYGAFPTLGEDWVMTPNKGFVGWMSDTDFGLDQDQHDFLTRFYQLAFNDPTWYGKPLAAIQMEVLRRLQTQVPNIPATAFGVSMMMNISWQGDPALALFSPDKPDYQFTPSVAPIALEPVTSGPVLASTRNFNLRLRLSNYGKIEPVRQIRISITRTVAGGTTIPTPPVLIPYYRRDTTVVVSITNPTTPSVFGNNTFTVKIDDPNVIAELDENNNTATFTYNFLNGGITIINPTEYSIVGRANVRLVGQSNMVQAQPLNYEFQLDTIPTFAAPVLQATVNALDVATWTPNLPARPSGRDSVVYYWRVRFQPGAAPGLDNSWVSSSFRFISGSPGGWSQSHYGQMANNTKTQLTQAAPSGRWSFAEITRALQLQTKGARSASIYEATFLQSYGLTVNGSHIPVADCGQPNLSPGTVSPSNIMAAVFDGTSLQQLTSIPGGTYQQCGDVSGGRPYFHFATTRNDRTALSTDNINSAARQGELLTFLQNVPNGAYVALVSMNRVNFSSFRADLKAQLAAMGSSLISTAQDGDPLVMVLHKGFPSQVQEATFSPGSTVPRDSQVVTLNYTLRANGTRGTLTSTRIGPAQEWQTLYHTVKRPDGAADQYTLRLIGYTSNDTRVVLNNNVTNTAQPLANINAATYPYLQLELVLRDSINRTPPQLKQWLVTYKGVPEGTVRRDHARIPANAYASATLSAAAASTGMLNVPVYFENVSSIDFGGLTRAKAYITQVRDGRQDTVSIRATPAVGPGFSRLPRADSTALYNFKLDVRGLSGDLTVRIVANANRLPELTDINNELNLSLTAPSINLPPVLDVAFDGQHILNGDIVSASPEILVDVKYEDKRRPLRDPNNVQLFLTRPGSTVPEQIRMTNGSLIRAVSDTVAGRFRVYYTPGTLPDGIYKLEVQAKDAANNQAANQRFAITFEVINQASITNVFPYPNPVTSKARFVFTLTGSTPPRNMKIQILTLSGKVVKEIMQAELGNVRVGNNITDYAWDGTDQYGDQLANGTYLYRVVLDDPESEYKHRRTAADQAFKKGWGKLVLLR